MDDRQPVARHFTHCKYGHPMSGDNLRIHRKPNGAEVHVCRTCARENMAQYRAAKPRSVRASRDILFWAKVNKDGPAPEHRPDLGPCWLWTGAVNEDGYGNFGVSDGKTAKSHRFAYELLVGPIPKGFVLDHLCLVRSCVNPAHLEAVTVAVNFFRSTAPPVLNAAKTHCPRGHAYSGDNLGTYTNKNGVGRKCFICSRMLTNARRARQRLEGVKPN